MFNGKGTDWESVNDEINLVNHKRKWFKWKKLWPLLSALFLALTATGSGAYFIFDTMVNALNFDDFKTPDLDLDGADFRVNMAEVPITSSSENLRLDYFETSLKRKAFDYLSKLSWWKILFSTNPDDFDFSWYKPKSDVKLDALDVARDGLDPCDLVITVKSSGFSFRINVASFVYNNAKFYENFMIFNRFETQYANVDDDYNPIRTNIANKGYLSESYSIKNGDPLAPYNENVYGWIKSRIQLFAQNEAQEMVSNAGELPIYPILTSIPAKELPDIDVDNLTTLIPYLNLVLHPTDTYFDEAGKYEQIEANSEFSIIYSPIPDLIEQLIAAGVSDTPSLDEFLKDNRLNFIPFVESNQTTTPTSSAPIKYTTPHDLIYQGRPKTKELTQYLYYASNTTNFFNFRWNIDPTVDRNISVLNIYLQWQIWAALRLGFSTLENALDLQYPNTLATGQQNFDYLNASENRFKNYFNQAFSSSRSSVAKVTYYDAFNSILDFPLDSPVPVDRIKHISVSFGPDVNTTPSSYNAQSFSYFFKVFWIIP